MGWQSVIVLILVLASCAYLLRRLWAQRNAGDETGGGCSCSAAKQCPTRKMKKTQ